ncbi:MAG: YceH family protein [Planctomycetota bacterium]
MSDAEPSSSVPPTPLSPAARRVLGVLIEKAKTTPDNYPMTLAAIITGCNQKSNRSPQMSVDETDVLLALDQLREAGAAREIQGSGRTNKYRHAAYEWLDLDNPTSAILTELLLRGPQTIGELRTRASRMYALDDLTAAQTAVDLLITKGLVEPLTPPGRGQTFAHKLYPPEERQYLEAKMEKRAGAAAAAGTASSSVASASKSVPNTAIDKIMERLDRFEEKLGDIEQRLSDIEGRSE